MTNTGDTIGDPTGRLLPLESAKWTLVGSANPSQKVRPGSNRSEVPGWLFQFVDPVKGVKMSKAVVWLWLTDKAAEDISPPANDYLPVSESLGKVSRWSAYLQASPEALKLWPTVKEDVKTALENDPKPTSTGAGDTAPNDADYAALHDRYKSLILAAAKAGNKDEISRLSDQFDASIGGKLLFVQVTLRVGPIAGHEAMFSKFFDAHRRISIGKLHLAVGDKPIVHHDLDGQGCVLIATHPLEGNKWPEDLQVTLLLDPVEREVVRKAAATVRPVLKATQWGEPKDGLRARLATDKQVFDAGEPILMKIEIENVSDEV